MSSHEWEDFFYIRGFFLHVSFYESLFIYMSMSFFLMHGIVLRIFCF
jgi:hypothetical protein